MKVFFVAVFIGFTFNHLSYAQINIKKSTKPQTFKTVYDSTDDFLFENLDRYKGQEIYIKKTSKKLKSLGYDGFYDPRDFDYIYKYPSYSDIYIPYKDIEEKSFKVIDVIEHPKAEESSIYKDRYYLKIQNKATLEICYILNSRAYFCIVGFFEKKKKESIGKEFVIRGRNWPYSSSKIYDFKKGNLLKLETGSVWKCIDFILENEHYTPSLVLENAKKESILIGLSQIDNTDYAFLKEDSDAYKNRFGAEKWNLILACKVRLDMTPEMCELSWGKPYKINKTIYSWGVHEQWVYDSQYLYFENGKLTTIQD